LAFRSKHELSASILESVQRTKNEARITRIMYESFISHKSITRNIRELLDLGLLKYDGRSKVFRITGKGQDFLEVVDEMNRMLVHNSM
jgi:predicted transcriptional regulator